MEGARKAGKTRKPNEQLIYKDVSNIPIKSLLKEFAQGEEDELALPGLTKNQRKDLHVHARRLGLKSRSYGCDNERVLCITRPKGKISFADAYKIEFPENIRQELYQMLPNLQARWQTIEAELKNDYNNKEEAPRWRGEPYLTGLGARIVPPRSGRIPHQLNQDKRELPIFVYQDEIMKLLQQNSVFIINGETGSGKSTQVPQYILNDAALHNRPCRIIVTQPRRVAVVSIAQRVAEERGEMLGKTVGYQIRLESK